MTIDALNQDLDALPLPDIDIEGLAVNSIGRDIILEKVHAHIRSARREGYELAMSKAQEGREPVAWLYTNHAGGVQAFTSEPPHRLKELCKPLYTSPPPKSDEAMDALIKAARWFADNPDSPKSALGHITEALAALAAQQSKGEA